MVIGFRHVFSLKDAMAQIARGGGTGLWAQQELCMSA
jgi:hypothetical protein